MSMEIRAAEAGETLAMRHLSRCHGTGTGVPRDLGRAWYWIRRACAAGDAAAADLAPRVEGMLDTRDRWEARRLEARDLAAGER